MEWSERMNTAIDYIEDNLAGEIDLNEVANIACCSMFHFQRMFFAIIGVTPAEYVRRRRLTLAARELSSANAKVIDVALKYGYNSPEAFARAFQNVHGINPKAARATGAKLTAYPRISFHIELKGGNDMDYRIIDHPAFDVVGRSRKFATANGEHLRKISEFWDEYIGTQEFQKLCDLTGGKRGLVTGAEILGVSIPIEGNSWNSIIWGKNTWDSMIYAISTEKSENMNSAGFEVFHIPAATWAIFECTPETEQDVAIRIWSEWFPSTGYEVECKPAIDAYIAEHFRRSPAERIEFWWPVVKKNKKK